MENRTYPYVLEDVALDSIHKDISLQIRGTENGRRTRSGLNWFYVEKYAAVLEAGDEKALDRPLNAVIGKNEELVLIDGFHFWHAYKQALKYATDEQTKQSLSRVRFVKVWGDARILSVDEIKAQAFEINDENGLPTPPYEQRERLRIHIRLGRHYKNQKLGRFKSINQIAKDL